MTTFASDAFGRSIAPASSWGTADAGGSWVAQFTTQPQYQVVPGQAQISLNSAHRTAGQTLPVAQADVEVKSRLSADQLPVGGVLFVGLLARFIDNQNFYRCEWQLAADGSIALGIYKMVAGVSTILGPQLHTFPSGDFTPGRLYVVRFQVQGSALRARYWRAADAEPTTWDLSQTDTDITAAGDVGYRSTIASAATVMPTTLASLYVAQSINTGVVNPVTMADTGASMSSSITAAKQLARAPSDNAIRNGAGWLDSVVANLTSGGGGIFPVFTKTSYLGNLTYSPTDDRLVALNHYVAGVAPWHSATQAQALTALQVTQRGTGANLSVDVQEGFAFIEGTDVINQGIYQDFNDGATNVVPQGFGAPATNPRIDAIIARVNDSDWTLRTPADQIYFDWIQGTASAGAQLNDPATGATYLLGAPGIGGGPALPASCLLLGYVLVRPAPNAIINTAQILDMRKLYGPRVYGQDGHQYRLGIDANGILGMEQVV